MNDEEMKSMQAYAAAAFGQPEASEPVPARKSQVGDSVIIRPGAVVNSAGLLAAQEVGTHCTIVEYEADDDGEDAVWNLPYCVEAPGGDTEWLRASEFDVVTEKIEVGDYVRIVEDVDMVGMGDDHDLIYLQDIQAGGVVREIYLNGYIVAFPRGVFSLLFEEVCLVDVAALRGEMEEMIAEEATDVQSEVTPEQMMTLLKELDVLKDRSVELSKAVIAKLQARMNEAEAELDILKLRHESVVNMYEARLADYARECEALQAEVNRLQKLNAEYGKMIDSANEWVGIRVRRITKLEAALTPFARAALDVRVKDSPDESGLMTGWWEKEINLSRDNADADVLKVRHLREALEVLPEVNAGSANASSEPA